MAAQTSSRVLVGAAFALVVASAVLFGALGWRNLTTAPAPETAVKLAEAAYTPVVSDAAPSGGETWSPPAAQSRGREWIYDAFTPPEIFYNARARQFTVKPPTGLVEDEVVEEAFGLELVSVRPEAFRLQLIGYVGEAGNWRGTFENLRSGEVFLAAAGRRVPNLALSIKRLDVEPQPVLLAGSMTTRQRVAIAVIHDERTGRDVTLTHRERHFTGMSFAMVAAAGETATREVRAGETFQLGAATYRIEQVQLSPPAITVTKQAPTLPQPDRRILTPRDSETPDAPELPSS